MPGSNSPRREEWPMEGGKSFEIESDQRWPGLDVGGARPLEVEGRGG